MYKGKSFVILYLGNLVRFAIILLFPFPFQNDLINLSRLDTTITIFHDLRRGTLLLVDFMVYMYGRTVRYTFRLIIRYER